MRLLSTLAFRVILLVVGVALLATTLALLAARSNYEEAIWEQVRADGELIGSVIAEAVALSREIPDRFEEDRGKDLATTAQVLAHYLALAERSRMPRQAVQHSLESLTHELGGGELWITDSTGRVVYSVPRDVPFRFSPDPVAQPQSSAFWPLLTGQAKTVVQPIRPRDLDGRPFKYVGVAGVDSPRIVQLGVDQNDVLELRARLSVSRLSDDLVRQSVLKRPLLVVDDQLQLVHEPHGAPLNGAPVPNESSRGPSLSAAQRDALQRALSTGQLVRQLEPDAAVIYRPYKSKDGRYQGAFAAGFSREGLDQLFQRQQSLAIQVGVFIVIASSILGWLASIPYTRRVGRITAVARSIRKGEFNALGDLEPDLNKRDEVGVLGQVVHTMGLEVRDRQAVLEAQVHERTHELAHRNQALAVAQATINEQLELAKRLQLGILPAAFPSHPGWQGAARIQMQQQMGGDFYDFIGRPDGTVAIVMADVSGKGIAAAFFMAMARTSLQHHLGKGLGPAQSLMAANEALCAANPLDLFVTAFVGVLDPRTGAIEQANAGHNPPMLRQANGVVRELGAEGELALGIMPGYVYPQSRFQMDPGEHLLAYTDGVTEAFNRDAQAYGVKRLLQWVVSPSVGHGAKDWVDAVFDEVLSFQGSAEQADDITVAVLHREAPLSSGPGQ